jgi:hypothetical protein
LQKNLLGNNFPKAEISVKSSFAVFKIFIKQL